MTATLERLCIVCGRPYVPSSSNYICPDCARKANVAKEG